MIGTPRFLTAVTAGMILVGVLGAAGGGPSAELNLYEWSALAPIVVVGRGISAHGPFLDLVIDEVVRGPSLAAGDTVRIRLRRANRERNRSIHRRSLRFEEDASYLVLLEPVALPSGKEPAFDLVRGVQGARILPNEGARVQIDALNEISRLQGVGDERLRWTDLEQFLDATNPLLIHTALLQMTKFRRGTLDLLPTVRPLLTHPRTEIRRQAVVLVQQILERHDAEPIPESDAVLAEVVGLARRDPVPGVRIEATRALNAMREPAVETVLREIADADPEQEVRYVAQKALIERRGSRPATGEERGDPDDGD